MALLVDDVPDLELMAPVELSIVCFRYVPNSLREDEEQLDALNKRIMEEVQAGGKAFVNDDIALSLRPALMCTPLCPDRGRCGGDHRGSVPGRRTVPGVIKPDRPRREAHADVLRRTTRYRPAAR